MILDIRRHREDEVDVLKEEKEKMLFECNLVIFAHAVSPHS